MVKTDSFWLTRWWIWARAGLVVILILALRGVSKDVKGASIYFSFSRAVYWGAGQVIGLCPAHYQYRPLHGRLFVYHTLHKNQGGWID